MLGMSRLFGWVRLIVCFFCGSQQPVPLAWHPLPHLEPSVSEQRLLGFYELKDHTLS